MPQRLCIPDRRSIAVQSVHRFERKQVNCVQAGTVLHRGFLLHVFLLLLASIFRCRSGFLAVLGQEAFVRFS